LSRSIVTDIAFYENSLDYKSIEDIKLIGIGRMTMMMLIRSMDLVSPKQHLCTLL
jgi:hypothetical protein